MNQLNQNTNLLLIQAGACFKKKNSEEARNFYCQAGDAALASGYLDGVLRAGSGLENLGDFAIAQVLYQKGMEKFPDNYALPCRLGALLIDQDLNPQALPFFEKGLELNPNDPDVLFNAALAYQANHSFDKTLELLQKALEKGADKGLVYGSIAEVYEQTNKLDELEKHLEKGLRETPDDVFLIFNSAKLARRKGDLETALSLLEKIRKLPDAREIKMPIEFEMGRVYDKLGKHELAYSCFVKGNLESLKQPNIKGLDKKTSRQIITSYKALNLDNWLENSAGDLPDEIPTPAFLVGFPRSGTTLLHQILEGHSDIDIIEEGPIVANIKQLIFEKYGNFSTSLEQLDHDQWNRLRNECINFYRPFKTKGAFTQTIDKLPLNIVDIPIILKLLPKAKFIVALRHPFDCSFSCFMQNFNLNNPMANFSNLDDATRYYEMVFDLWLHYEEKLKFDHIYVRYEDLVANHEAEAKKIIKFLNQDWQPEVLDYQKKALEKDFIKTPSYHQVIQPIYNSAIDRWRGYEKFLSPYRKRVERFCKAFGYQL